MNQLKKLKEYIRLIQWDDPRRFNKETNAELSKLLKQLEHFYYNPVPIPDRLIDAIQKDVLYDPDIIKFFNDFILDQCIKSKNINFSEIYKGLAKSDTFWKSKKYDGTPVHSRMIWKFASILFEIFILFEKMGFVFEVYHPYFHLKVHFTDGFDVYMLIRNNIKNINKMSNEENKKEQQKITKKMFSKFIEIPKISLKTTLGDGLYSKIIYKYCGYMTKIYYKLNTINKIIFLKTFIKEFNLGDHDICNYKSFFNRNLKNSDLNRTILMEVFEIFFWLMVDFAIENKLTLRKFCEYFLSPMERKYELENIKFPFSKKETMYLELIVNTPSYYNSDRAFYLISGGHFANEIMKIKQKKFSKDITKKKIKKARFDAISNHNNKFKSLITYNIVSYISQLKF